LQVGRWKETTCASKPAMREYSSETSHIVNKYRRCPHCISRYSRQFNCGCGNISGLKFERLSYDRCHDYCK
jgi:hypothetical protein